MLELSKSYHLVAHKAQPNDWRRGSRAEMTKRRFPDLVSQLVPSICFCKDGFSHGARSETTFGYLLYKKCQFRYHGAPFDLELQSCMRRLNSTQNLPSFIFNPPLNTPRRRWYISRSARLACRWHS